MFNTKGGFQGDSGFVSIPLIGVIFFMATNAIQGGQAPNNAIKMETSYTC
jgi:hypothetical protein